MGRESPPGQQVRGLEVTRLRRSPNAKEAVREGTDNMQRESLMLSRFRLSWKVILENHFPSLADGFFYVRTSNRALYTSSPLTCCPGGLSLPIPDRLGFIRSGDQLQGGVADGGGGLWLDMRYVILSACYLIKRSPP